MGLTGEQKEAALMGLQEDLLGGEYRGKRRLSSSREFREVESKKRD